MRGTKLTMMMGSNTIKKIISNLEEDVELLIEIVYQNLHIQVIKRFRELIEKLQ